METGKYVHENMSLIKRFGSHLKTVCTHKKYVAEGCFKLGLYRQGILHDLSKFSPAEFLSGVRYYDGHKSPNTVERQLNDGCSKAWLHHKGRNRHHFEYWVDFTSARPEICYGTRMPVKYVAEMVCDRTAACKTYNGSSYTPADPWAYYSRGREFIIIHPDTRALLEKCLILMRDEGEDSCFAYLRKVLREFKGSDYTAERLGLAGILRTGGQAKAGDPLQAASLTDTAALPGATADSTKLTGNL